MRHGTDRIAAFLRRRASEGATLAQVADEIEAGALARDRATARIEAVPIVRMPRQISTLPESKQGPALAHVERIADEHRKHGTEPTPIPKGAQR